MRSARSVLEVLGWPAHEAREAAMSFRRGNESIMNETHPHYKDYAKVIAMAKEGRQQFEEQMARVRALRKERSGRGWDEEAVDEKGL